MKLKTFFLASSALLLASCGATSSSSSHATGLSSSEEESSSSHETGLSSSDSHATGLSSSEEESSSSHETGLSSSEESTSSDSSAEPYKLNLNVAVPAGAPAVAFYRHLQADDGKLEINADASNVVGYLSANSGKDIVVAPTNAGIMAIKNKNAPYTIAATLTFGNFYLAATGNDANGTLDNDDYVIAFQQNNVPDKIFRSVYPSLSNVHYLAAASDAQKALISGIDESNDNASVDYVLIAEPAFSAAKSKKATISQYADIQAQFKAAHNGLEITQASLFVSNTAEKTKVNALLSSIEEDIGAFLDDTSVIDPYLEGMEAQAIQSKFSAPLAMLKNCTANGNRMGLGYKSAYANKDSVTNFMSLWNVSSLDEEIFYR